MNIQHNITWILSGLLTTCLSSAGFYLLTVIIDYLRNYHRMRRSNEKLTNGFLHMDTRVEEQGAESAVSSSFCSPASSSAALFAAYKRTRAYMFGTANPSQTAQRWPAYYLRRPRLWSSVPPGLEGLLANPNGSLADAICPHCKKKVIEPETANCRAGLGSSWEDVSSSTSKTQSGSGCQDSKQKLSDKKKKMSPHSKGGTVIKDEQNQIVTGPGMNDPTKLLQKGKVNQDLEVIPDCLESQTSGECVRIRPQDSHENGFHLDIWNKVVTEYPFIVPFLESGFLEEVNRDIQCQNEKELLHTMDQQRNSERTVAKFQQFLRLRHLCNMKNERAISLRGKETYKMYPPSRKSSKINSRKPESISSPQQSPVVKTPKKLASNMTYSLIRKKMQLQAFSGFVSEKLTDRETHSKKSKGLSGKGKAIKALKATHKASIPAPVIERIEKRICWGKGQWSSWQDQDHKGFSQSVRGFSSTLSLRQNFVKPEIVSGSPKRVKRIRSPKKSRSKKGATLKKELKKDVAEQAGEQNSQHSEGPKSSHRKDSEMLENEICGNSQKDGYFQVEPAGQDDPSTGMDPWIQRLSQFPPKSDRVPINWFQVPGNDFGTVKSFMTDGIFTEDKQKSSICTEHKVSKDETIRDKKSKLTKTSKEDNDVKDTHDNDPCPEAPPLSTINEESNLPLLSDSTCKDIDGNTKLRDASLASDGLQTLPDLIRIQEQMLAGRFRQNEHKTTNAGHGDQECSVDLLPAGKSSKEESCPVGRCLQQRENKLSNKKTNQSSEKIEMKKVDSSARQPVSFGFFRSRNNETPLRYRGSKGINCQDQINSRSEGTENTTSFRSVRITTPDERNAKSANEDEEVKSINAERKTIPATTTSKLMNKNQDSRSFNPIRKTSLGKTGSKPMNKSEDSTSFNPIRKTSPLKRYSKPMKNAEDIKGSCPGTKVSPENARFRQMNRDENRASFNSDRRRLGASSGLSTRIMGSSFESPNSRPDSKRREETKDPSKSSVVRRVTPFLRRPYGTKESTQDKQPNRSIFTAKPGIDEKKSYADHEKVSSPNKETKCESVKPSIQKSFHWSKPPFIKLAIGSKSTLNKLSNMSDSSKMSNRSKSPVRKLSNKSKSPVNKLSNRSSHSKMSNSSKSPVMKLSNRSQSPLRKLSNRSQSPVKKLSNRSKSPVTTVSKSSNRSKSPVSKMSNRSKSPVGKLSNRSISPASKLSNRSKSPVRKLSSRSLQSKKSNNSKSPVRKLSNRSKSPVSKLSKNRSKSPVHKLSNSSKSPVRKLSNRSKSPVSKLSKNRSKSPVKTFSNRSKSPVMKMSKRSKTPVKKFSNRSKTPVWKLSNKSKLPTGNLSNRSKSSLKKLPSRSKSPCSKLSNESESLLGKLSKRSNLPPCKFFNESKSPLRRLSKRLKSPQSKFSNWSKSSPSNSSSWSRSTPRMSNWSRCESTNKTESSVSISSNGLKSPLSLSSNRSKSPLSILSNRSKSLPHNLSKRSKSPFTLSLSDLSDRSTSPVNKASSKFFPACKMSRAASRAERHKKAGREVKRRMTWTYEQPCCDDQDGIEKVVTQETIVREKIEVSITSEESDNSEESCDTLREEYNCKREIVLKQSVLDDVVRQIQDSSTSLYTLDKFSKMCEDPVRDAMNGSASKMAINMTHSLAISFSTENLKLNSKSLD